MAEEEYYNEDGVHDPFADLKKGTKAKQDTKGIKRAVLATLLALAGGVAAGVGSFLGGSFVSGGGLPEERIIAAAVEIGQAGEGCDSAPDLEFRQVSADHDLEADLATLRAEGFVHTEGALFEIDGPNGPIVVEVLFGQHCSLD